MHRLNEGVLVKQGVDLLNPNLFGGSEPYVELKVTLSPLFFLAIGDSIAWCGKDRNRQTANEID